MIGINPQKGRAALISLPSFLLEYQLFCAQAKTCNHAFQIGRLYPCLHDRFEQGGTANGHYFHQDLLVSRKIFHNNPERHVDIGSRIDGFVAHVAVFREIEVFDIRDLRTTARNIKFRRIDFMKPIAEVGYCDSLSCLNALEHFGLGRYGDPIDFLGHEKALKNMTQLLRDGGKLYLSVPIGPQRIEFNAHRVFAANSIIDLLKSDFILNSFSYVDDQGDVHEDVSSCPKLMSHNFGCRFGCGIFEFTKTRARSS